jgi:YhcH/YjgK/YiaL family protein
MIVDSLQNAAKYYGVHPSFQKAFAFLQQTDLNNLADGRFSIDGDNVKAIVSNKDGMTADNRP